MLFRSDVQRELRVLLNAIVLCRRMKDDVDEVVRDAGIRERLSQCLNSAAFDRCESLDRARRDILEKLETD